MHAYFLYSQVERTRHKQVLEVLTAVTESQPVNISEHYLLYKQLKSADAASKKAAKQTTAAQRQLTYHKLVRDVHHSDPSDWKLLIEEQPDAGVKDIISRTISESEPSQEELQRFQESSGWYTYVRWVNYRVYPD